jgi:tripartite-type tricarboxylate transporter receptor subunit TctC
MPRVLWNTLAVMTVAVISMLAATSAPAQSVAEFYRGKTIHMVIGYGAGGGYDLYGRLAAEFLGKHIPGNPNVVPQNMPGGGSFRAAQFLHSVAAKDGTYLGSVSQTLALDTAMAEKRLLDATELPYLGRLTTNIDTGVALLKTGIKSFDDVRKKQYSVGTTGGASTAVLLPSSLNAFGGAQFKLVKGYQGAAEVLIALERGEVEVAGAVGVPNLLTRHPDWLKGGATILYQAALNRHPLLPNVPTLPELGLTDEGKMVLRAIASTAEIGRSILTTPGVPPERLSALRKAFAEMVKDPAFLAAAKKRNITIEPGTGEAMDEIVRETMRTPKNVLKNISKLVN